jgi:hypothetical protein
MAPPFLTLALDGGEWSASPPKKKPPVPIELETGWAPDRSGSCGVEKNILPLPGIEPRASIL